MSAKRRIEPYHVAAAVLALLAGKLNAAQGATCDHHHEDGHDCGSHGEGHTCGEHGCGGHSCGSH